MRTNKRENMCLRKIHISIFNIHHLEDQQANHLSKTYHQNTIIPNICRNNNYTQNFSFHACLK